MSIWQSQINMGLFLCDNVRLFTVIWLKIICSSIQAICEIDTHSEKYVDWDHFWQCLKPPVHFHCNQFHWFTIWACLLFLITPKQVTCLILHFSSEAFLISFQSGRKKGYRAVSMVIEGRRNNGNLFFICAVTPSLCIRRVCDWIFIYRSYLKGRGWTLRKETPLSLLHTTRLCVRVQAYVFFCIGQHILKSHFIGQKSTIYMISFTNNISCAVFFAAWIFLLTLLFSDLIPCLHRFAWDISFAVCTLKHISCLYVPCRTEFVWSTNNRKYVSTGIYGQLKYHAMDSSASAPLHVSSGFLFPAIETTSIIHIPPISRH